MKTHSGKEWAEGELCAECGIRIDERLLCQCPHTLLDYIVRLELAQRTDEILAKQAFRLLGEQQDLLDGAAKENRRLWLTVRVCVVLFVAHAALSVWGMFR